MLIYLIGGRGCGKTTVGSQLAKQKSCKFIDLDEWLCVWQQADVAEIVQKVGWPGFRALENQALRHVTKELAKEQCAVIATGGGIILAQENRSFLKKNGLVFWLDVNLQNQTERLTRSPLNGQRPSLTGQDMLAELASVMNERRPLYEQSCHHKIAADASPEAICAQIDSLIGIA